MSFLSVILDCNQFNWGTTIANHKESGLDVHKEIIRATISLCNSHLFSSLNNHLTLIAGGITQTSKKFAYEKNQNQENFTESIEKFIYDNLSKSISRDDSTSHYAGAISLSICSFQKFKKQFPNSTGKIVIINLADDLSREQNVLMNLFFASRQHSLKVDVASLNGSVPILQQASDITGGVHLLITDYKLLAQELLGNSFVDGQNPIFKRPSSDMDYRAVCHCHNKLISIGWVCSVCLSVTCNFVPFCKICNAIFPRPMPLYNQQKRPRKI